MGHGTGGFFMKHDSSRQKNAEIFRKTFGAFLLMIADFSFGESLVA
jgi:hypothetical protein